MAVIIAGPNYGMSMTYEEWEVIDEPMFDILCGGLSKEHTTKVFTKDSKKINH